MGAKVIFGNGSDSQMGGKKEGGRTSGTVGVEDTSNADVNTVLTMESVSQSLRNTLSFVVASTRADWVHMSPANGLLGSSLFLDQTNITY